MSVKIIVPAAGESVTEADISTWYKSDGDFVEMDEALVELETDKASLDLNAEVAGTLKILVEEGTVKVGDVIGEIISGGTPPKKSSEAPETLASVLPVENYAKGHPSPSAAKAMAEAGVKSSDIVGTGRDGRITKSDVPSVPVPSKPAAVPDVFVLNKPSSRDVERKRMSRIRRTIAQRLVNAQKTAALLTTFNEVDMSGVMAIRAKYKEKFKEKNQVGLGFMSFFTKAVCDSLLKFPILNATIEGEEIVYHNYCDIGIAVSTPKGLVVPVIRDAEHLNFMEIESQILKYALKGRDGKLGPDDMSGGTFTITNGGTFGSMLSTPIVNHPQSAILGMHNIIKRPVAVGDKVEIRPIMYLAVTYDHRIIDGSDAVQFLVSIKELIEDPTRLLIGL